MLVCACVCMCAYFEICKICNFRLQLLWESTNTWATTISIEVETKTSVTSLLRVPMSAGPTKEKFCLLPAIYFYMIIPVLS